MTRLLERLVLEAEDPAWRAWAQGELIKLRARLETPPEGPATRPAMPE